MTKRTIGKVITATAAALGFAAMAAAPALAQGPGTAPTDNQSPAAESGYGPGYGPGMMRGGYGYGMGPGYGMGYHGGYGSGWGRRGWMMGGYGGGYGPGMMWGGYGWGPETAGALGLSESQQKQIRDIQERLGKQQWGLMRSMHGQMRRLWHTYGRGEDIDAIIKARREMFDTRLQMLRNRLEAQKQVRAVLTEAQRKKLDELEHWRGEYPY